MPVYLFHRTRPPDPSSEWGGRRLIPDYSPNPSPATTGLESSALLLSQPYRHLPDPSGDRTPNTSCRCRDTAEANSEDGCRCVRRLPLTSPSLTAPSILEPRNMIGGRDMSPMRLVNAGKEGRLWTVWRVHRSHMTRTDPRSSLLIRILPKRTGHLDGEGNTAIVNALLLILVC